METISWDLLEFLVFTVQMQSSLQFHLIKLMYELILFFLIMINYYFRMLRRVSYLLTSPLSFSFSWRDLNMTLCGILWWRLVDILRHYYMSLVFVNWHVMNLMPLSLEHPVPYLVPWICIAFAQLVVIDHSKGHTLQCSQMQKEPSKC